MNIKEESELKAMGHVFELKAMGHALLNHIDRERRMNPETLDQAAAIALQAMALIEIAATLERLVAELAADKK